MAGKAKIYTKGGDLGETSLLGGTRVPKSHDRVEAYGTIDELNAFIGLLRDQISSEPYLTVLLAVQENLFVIEALIAADPEKSAQGLPLLEENTICVLESEIDRMTAEMEPLDSFILPGGHPLVSLCHVCRTVCRRSERTVIRVHQNSSINPIIIRYLNRLSDYFFVLARKISQDAGIIPITWPSKKQSK